MNLRITIVLFVVLAVGLAGFAALQLWDIKTSEQRTERDKWLFPTLKQKNAQSSDFAGVSLKRVNEAGKEETLEFKREGGEWKMTSPYHRKTNSGMVDELVFQLIGMARPPMSDVSGKDSETGLDHPTATVTLTLDSKRASELGVAGSYEAKIGTGGDWKSPVLYVSGSESKTPIAVARNRLERVLAPIADFRSRDLLTTPEGQLTGMKIKASGQELLSFARLSAAGERGQPGETAWRFTAPPLGWADRGVLTDIASRITKLKVQRNEDFVFDGELKQDSPQWNEYGLALPLYEITLLKKGEGDAAEESLVVGKRTASSETLVKSLPAIGAFLSPLGGEDLALAVLDRLGDLYAQEVKTGRYFAMLPGQNSVVRVDLDYELTKLLARGVDEYRDRHIVRFDRPNLDAMTIRQPEGEVLRFRRTDLKKPEAWDLYYKERPRVGTHGNLVHQLITDLSRVELNALETGKPSPFLDNEDRRKAWFGTGPIKLGFDDNDIKTVVELTVNGLLRDKDGNFVDAEGKTLAADKEPLLDPDKKPMRLTFGARDEARGVVYVKREVEKQETAILAVPDPWSGPLPPPRPGDPTPAPERVFLLAELNQPYLAFRDHLLPSFSLPEGRPGDPPLTGIVKASYTRNGEVYEIDIAESVNDRGVKEERWSLAKPLADRDDTLRARFMQFLGTLVSRLNADILLSDTATEEDFAKHGLTAKARIKLAVVVRDKDKKERAFTWYIGDATDPKGLYPNHFYARVNVESTETADTRANRFLFLVPWSTVRELDVELRNPVIFPFEGKNAPESAILTWRRPGADKKIVETRLELVNEPSRPGDSRRQWTVKSLTVDGKDRKADLNDLDTAKLTQLFDLRGGARENWPILNGLTTPRFTLQQGDPFALKAGLDPASKDRPPQLIIEARYAGDTGARTLIIGDRWEPKSDLDSPRLALTSPFAYYQATSANLPVNLFAFADWLGGQLPYPNKSMQPPNSAFLIEESKFKDLVEGWQFFQREPPPSP